MDSLAKTQVGSTPHYRVALVEKSAAPPGAKGENWRRYVLENGCASITGWRRGSLQEIMQYAIDCTERLNTPRSHSVYRPPQHRKTAQRAAAKSG